MLKTRVLLVKELFAVLKHPVGLDFTAKPHSLHILSNYLIRSPRYVHQFCGD